MKALPVICWIFTALALSIMVGCNKTAQKAGEPTPYKLIGTASPGETGINVGQDKTQIETSPDGEVDGHAGEGEATTKPKTGTAVSKLKPLSMPDSWPTAFPQYADSTITASQSSTEKGIAKMKVTLSTNDPVGRVEKFYSEKAKTAGYKTGTSRDMGPARIRHYVSDEFIVDVNIIQNSRTVVINISVRTTRGS